MRTNHCLQHSIETFFHMIRWPLVANEIVFLENVILRVFLFLAFFKYLGIDCLFIDITLLGVELSTYSYCIPATVHWYYILLLYSLFNIAALKKF